MAGFRQENRVGSNVNPQPTPVPSPSATNNPPKIGSFAPESVVKTVEKTLGIKLSSGASSIGRGEALIDTLSNEQKTTLAKLLKSLGYSVKSLSAIKTTLNENFVNQYNNATSFADLYNQLAAEYIPGVSGGAGKKPSMPTQTVTQYTDTQLKDLGNAVAQNFLGRNLETAEIETILPKLKKIVEAGTTTTSKVVGGKNVVTVTPGFSQARAQSVVEAELKKSAADDLQVKQYQDNVDWLSKNMAGM